MIGEIIILSLLVGGISLIVLKDRNNILNCIENLNARRAAECAENKEKIVKLVLSYNSLKEDLIETTNTVFKQADHIDQLNTRLNNILISNTEEPKKKGKKK